MEQFFSLQLLELLHLTGKHFDRIPRAGRLWLWLGGAAYIFLVLPFLQLDVSGGAGLTDISPIGFISVGLSWRIPR